MNEHNDEEENSPFMDNETRLVSDLDRKAIPKGPEKNTIHQYKKFTPDISADEFNLVIAELETKVMDESYGATYHMDTAMVEQAALLDIAFRYYFSGGESEKINPESFKLALKAQSQCSQILRDARRSRRQPKIDKLRYDEYCSKATDREIRNGSLLEKLLIKVEKAKNR